MPSSRNAALASRDRAERHVFGALPELPAVERRVLALIELSAASVAEAAADLGIEQEAARAAAATARKALRRERAALASGSRCERAERLLSDRLDAPLERLDRKWLEIHMARCSRCIEHEALLDQARTELRVTFAAPDAKQLPPAPPEPPALEAGRAQLRVVPATAVPTDPPADTGRDVSVRGDSEIEARKAAKIAAIVLAIMLLLAAAGYELSQIIGH